MMMYYRKINMMMMMCLLALHLSFFFTARCYAERGIATASRPSVCLSPCLWRWGIMVTYVGILQK